MQTTCRFFYGTNWSPAANSGQRGPWSYQAIPVDAQNNIELLLAEKSSIAAQKI